MREFCLQIAGVFFATLLSLNLLAAPQVQTIPVSVSNTVSGAFETVPVTFRFGGTNGVVERLEGEKFVSVAASADKLVSVSSIPHGYASCPEINNVNRLKKLLLPELKLDGGIYANVLSNLFVTIHKEDKEARDPIEFSSRVQRTSGFDDRAIYTPDIKIPQTNAMDALHMFIDVVNDNEKRIYSKAGKKCPEKPTGLRLRENEFIFVGPDWDYDEPVTRAYAMPDEFLNHFKDDEVFTRYLVRSLTNSTFTVDYDFSASIMRNINKVRIHARPGVIEEFESWLSELRWLSYLHPEKVVPCQLEKDDKSLLFLRGYKTGAFDSLWKYYAVIEKDGSVVDKLIFCEIDMTMGKECVKGPEIYGVYDEVEAGPVAELFVLRSNDGLVSRVGSDRISVIFMQESEDSWFHGNNNLYVYTNAIASLKKVIIPEFAMKNDHVTNGLAIIQNELSKVSDKADEIKLVWCVTKDEEADVGKEAVSSDPFARPDLTYNSWSVITSAFGARYISAYDALKLLLDITGLYWRMTESNTIEIVTPQMLEKESGIEITVNLPELLLKNYREYNVKYKHDWVTDFNTSGIQYVDWEKGLVTFSLDSRATGIYGFEEYLQSLYSRFPNRYKLENKTVNGKPELLLIDTYRNITRRYHSWMENGQRRERFEIVK